MKESLPTDKLDKLKRLSTLLDSQFEGPMGVKFGLDALLGLLPGAGDFITSLFSFYILAVGASLGAGPSTLVRMAWNVFIDNVFNVIPFVGNVFDFYWKSNNRNIILLASYVENPRKETLKSRFMVVLIFILLISLLALFGWVTFKIFAAFYAWLSSH